MTLTLSLSGRDDWRDAEGEGVETTFGYLDMQLLRVVGLRRARRHDREDGG
jgi:hypothetical protein